MDFVNPETGIFGETRAQDIFDDNTVARGLASLYPGSSVEMAPGFAQAPYILEDP